MKINIYYFSGTYNTLKVAQTLQERLSNLGAETTLADISRAPAYSFADTLIIAYPVYGFNPPSIVINFVKDLPLDVAQAYLIKTSGEPLKLNDASSQPLVKMLKKKGYKVMGEYHYVMPYNMIFKHTDEMATKMLKTAIVRIESDSLEILHGVFKPISMPFISQVMRTICSVEHVGMRLNGKLYKVDTTKCIRCNLCHNGCPTKNISVKNGSFKFGGNCLGCARCAFHCPTDAITTGLLNFLKVNGKYNFNADDCKAIIPKYCKKSYERYFSVENPK